MVRSINRSIKRKRTTPVWAPHHVASAVFAIALGCGSAGTGEAGDQTIAVAASGCAQAAQYSPPAGVAYEPGVDQQGRPVVPADIQDERHQVIRDSITIILSSDLEERFGIPHESALLAADAVIGIVDVRIADGRLTFNGVPLNDREALALSELCRRATGQH